MNSIFLGPGPGSNEHDTNDRVWVVWRWCGELKILLNIELQAALTPDYQQLDFFCIKLSTKIFGKLHSYFRFYVSYLFEPGLC